MERPKTRGTRPVATRAPISTRPGTSSQGRPNLPACKTAGARSRSASIRAGQPRPKRPSGSAYHGSTRKPRLPRMLQINALRRRPRPMVPPLLRLAIDLFLPSLEQPLALRLRAVLREIVVDQLDLGELGSLGRQLGLQVGRHLELLVVGTDLLGRSGQRPVDRLLVVDDAARALDDGERADRVDRALARGLALAE